MSENLLPIAIDVLAICVIALSLLIMRMRRNLVLLDREFRLADVQVMGETKARFQHIEMQLGRTMRAVGVPGDPNAITQADVDQKAVQ